MAFLVWFLLGRQKWLYADLVVTNSDIGIPNISKNYKAVLINKGVLPVLVTRCENMDNTDNSSVACAIQKWDVKTHRWKTIAADGKDNYCQFFPNAKLARKWLWPGKKLSTAEEAVAAQVEYNYGDRARFIVFTNEPGDYSSSLTTKEFIIDEHSGEARVGAVAVK